MSYLVDFETVSTKGLTSSPVAEALAGLRANEARYFKNKYDHDFTVEPASKAKKAVAWVHRILEGRARHRHRVSPARGDCLRGREHPHGLRLLRERALDQRDVHRSTIPRSAPSDSSCPTAWRCPPSLPRASSSPDRSPSWPARSAARSS